MSTEPDPDPEAAPPPAAPSLARAFWLWFLLGSALLLLGLPTLVGVLAGVSGPLVVAIMILWIGGTPLYALVTSIMVWRRGRQARPLWRWASRVGVLVSIVSVAAAAWIFVAVQPDYTIRAKVQEGVNQSNPARTAIGIACSEGELSAGMSHEDLGLESAEAYSGRVHRQVQVEVESATRATVTITMKAIKDTTMLTGRPGISDGQTLVYIATCASDGVTWDLSGSVAETYRPRM